MRYTAYRSSKLYYLCSSAHSLPWSAKRHDWCHRELQNNTKAVKKEFDHSFKTAESNHLASHLGEVHRYIMSIPLNIKELVSGATFEIRLKKGGCGLCVLIENDLIITAAHCVDWNCTSMTTNREYYLNRIATDSGDFIATTLAVEPVSDIAVLGCPDAQIHYQESTAFDECCEGIVPVKLLRKTPQAFSPFPVWIWTHLKTWVAGTATYYADYATFAYQTDSEIINGTSGGPIVNDAGELVGVVSHGANSPSGGEYASAAALLPLALPAWAIARVKEEIL